MKNVKEAIKEKYKSEIGFSFRNPDDYIIDASNRLSPNLDTEFNTTGKGENGSELEKVTLYLDYHGLAVDNENLVKESYNSNIQSFYEYRGKKVYSVDELRSLYDNDIKVCDDPDSSEIDYDEEELESLQSWCKENSFEPEEINYYDYGGFLWSTQESFETQIKKDIRPLAIL